MKAPQNPLSTQYPQWCVCVCWAHVNRGGHARLQSVRRIHRAHREAFIYKSMHVTEIPTASKIALNSADRQTYPTALWKGGKTGWGEGDHDRRCL
jgi:hypothetical protein